MNEMKNQLISVNKKKESHNKRMDKHLYSRRIGEVFSSYKWRYRDAKIIEENMKKVDIFQTEVNVDNIDDQQKYKKYFYAFKKHRNNKKTKKQGKIIVFIIYNNYIRIIQENPADD